MNSFLIQECSLINIMELPKKNKQMDKEDLDWLISVQSQAYRLYAINKMPDDDYRLLDNTIDQILENNNLHNSDEDLQP